MRGEVIAAVGVCFLALVTATALILVLFAGKGGTSSCEERGGHYVGVKPPVCSVHS